jgi:uncharacterized protein (DUF2141 family)
MIRRFLVLVVASLIVAAAAAPPFDTLEAPRAASRGQVRDNATPVASGTASITGTVFLAGESKRPARRARVTLTSLDRTTTGQTATTDDRGAFAFHALPAGRFELQAFKPGYLRASFGASRPERAGTPIVLQDGQTITDLTMTIARGGVITGLVRDARGRPVPGANVRVLKLAYHAVTGERTLVAPGAASTSITDDRGEYRAYGLPPGGYLVLVPPPERGRPWDQTDIRRLTSDDVRRGMDLARAGAPPRPPVTKPGFQPSSSSTAARLNYAPIFHPGVTNIGAAATIPLGVSDERTGVDVTVELVPTATISGRIRAPSGDPPQRLLVSVVPAGADASMLAGAGLRGMSALPSADGTYVVSGVPPGAYTIKAVTSLGGGRGTPVPDGQIMWAAADVQVSGQDLEVPLTLQPGVPIKGRVIFEGLQPSPAEISTLTFSLVAVGSSGAALWSGGGKVDADGRFGFASVPPDTYQFVAKWTTSGADDKWTIKSSMANDRDAFESPLRVDPGRPLDWVVTFTDKPAVLTGTLQDGSGRAATDYYIVIFSSDRGHWTPGSRRVRVIRPATDGAFVARGLPAGEYFIAALTDLEPGESNDPTLLAQLASAASKVTLRDGATTTQDFRIGR